LHLPPSSHVSLSQLRPSQEAIIERVEAADPNLLRYLGTLGLTPQAQVTALEYSPFDGNLRLNIHDQAKALVLGPGVTRHIFVRTGIL
jgi:Fe2+ transport system protein FeoA